MSRIELHCPSCGYDVPPTLMPPPKMFSCPECLEVMPREKLTRLKVVHRNIAGANVLTNSMSATVVGTGNFYDAGAATGSLSIANCVFAAGDLCVLCVSLNVAGGAADVSAANVGGSALANADVSTFPGIRNDQVGAMWIRHNVTAGTKTVAITAFTANPTACGAVVVAVSGAKTSAALDGSVTQSLGTAAFDTLTTNPLVLAGEFAVAMVAAQQTDLVGATSWNLGFVQPSGARAGTHSGGPPNDTMLDVAFKPLFGTGPVQATGTLAGAVDHNALVATFKPR